ncbi:SCY1 protein kinase [Thecamonas trahens ATCC 50062]|uniref:SCY1 protein kinase n=1 Tax=Thecamonas trahens ATCC 50062 TaxID=461836 RepID=A0A0L0DCB5_THETB|nr:SCY1 protein kinase [Thecamonas trahens ATCC 50062]KNC49984.1 SCY1 protein kinase [Thecamonas trahens ATCC 50062]|eukprot:XP_013757153.1 SCY1 protein kinase [Thecamonas trahens ATCC 50062]
MGNGIAKDYDVGPQVGSGGPFGLWKIFSAVPKGDAGGAVSLFVFDKKAFAESHSKSATSRVVDLLRTSITKASLLCHPAILPVLRVLDETRQYLAFTSVPIFASLANCLHRFEGLDGIPGHLVKMDLEPLEAILGLANLSDALSFLHTQGKLVHGNLSPYNVYLCADGVWRLFGFSFSQHVGYGSVTAAAPPASSSSSSFFGFKRKSAASSGSAGPSTAWDGGRPDEPWLMPDLDYAAPEVVLGSEYGTGGPASDVFALAALAYEVLATDRSTSGGARFAQHGASTLTYGQWLRNLPGSLPSLAQALPAEIRSVWTQMLAPQVAARASLVAFVASPAFTSTAVKAVRYQLVQGLVFKGLAGMINTLPIRILELRVCPVLVRELREPLMVPFLLPNLAVLAPKISKTLVYATVLPGLSKHALPLATPPAVPLVLLQQLSMWLDLVPDEFVTNELVPFLLACLDGGRGGAEVIGAALSDLALVAPTIPYAELTRGVVPRVANLINGPHAVLRAPALGALAQLAPLLDAGVVSSTLIPLLEEVCGGALSDAPLVAAIERVYLEVGKSLPPQAVGTLVVPQLLKLAMAEAHTLSSFDAAMARLEGVLGSVRSARRDELRESSSLHAQMHEMVGGGSSGAADGMAGSGGDDNPFAAGGNPFSGGGGDSSAAAAPPPMASDPFAGMFETRGTPAVSTNFAADLQAPLHAPLAPTAGSGVDGPVVSNVIEPSIWNGLANPFAESPAGGGGSGGSGSGAANPFSLL